jgi:PAS domain S-box-containing protein
MAKYTTVELENLRTRLREAEETLSAIRNGEVDSLVVSGPHGDQVFSLKGAEQPYRVFVEQMLEGAVTLATDGTILYCNRRFAEMVHSRLEKVIGSQMKSFIRAGDQAELEKILHEPSKSKVRYVLEAADGLLVPAQLAFCRLPVDEVETICVVVTDLTEQEEKRELAAAMEKLRAVQAQLQLQNDALMKARQEAEAASDAKDNFLAALSHELRTPLTPALMIAESLQSDPSIPAGKREELELLRRNIELEARLIDDLLDLTRIVRGKIELRSGVVDVHSVIADALDICRGDLSNKRLEIIQALRATDLYVSGDAVRIQQILWNLIRNAVKFTPDGGQIIVRSHNDGDKLCVTIIDTGIGIEPEAIGRIFTPFEQAGQSITQQFGGLGLGLAISKRLAEMHGGTIVAQSEGRNRGATFIFTLPTIATPAKRRENAPAPVAGGNVRSLRILLVEDHEDTRRSLVRLLGRTHTVREAPSVESALAAAKEEQFDLVISDVGLPDGNGLELMRILRDDHGLKGICLSGFGMEEDIARSSDAGFCEHLTKPIDIQKLEAIIHSLVAT